VRQANDRPDRQRWRSVAGGARIPGGQDPPRWHPRYAAPPSPRHRGPPRERASHGHGTARRSAGRRQRWPAGRRCLSSFPPRAGYPAPPRPGLPHLRPERFRRPRKARAESCSRSVPGSAAVGPPRLVPGLGAADRPVILDAHEEHSGGPVGQTHHRLDEVAVVQPFFLLALELDLIGLPASDPLRDTQASPLPDPTASPCASSLYAKLCDTIASVSSDAYNFTRARIAALAARHLRHHAPPALVDAPGNLAPPGSQWCRQNPDLHERGINTPESDVRAERPFRVMPRTGCPSRQFSSRPGGQ